MSAPDEAERIARLLGRGGQLAFELDRLRSRGIWVVTIADDGVSGATARSARPGRAAGAVRKWGSATCLDGGGIAIVGSRDADEAAVGIHRAAGQAVARGGATVVSGRREGIDVDRDACRLWRRAVMSSACCPEGVERRLRDGATRAAVASGQAVLVSPYHPTAAFSAGAAMGRNKIIYALSDMAVVVSTASGSGGTWAGAIEAIEGGWVPVLVRDDPTRRRATADLIAKGGVPLSADALEVDTVTVDSLLSLVPVGPRQVPEDPSHTSSKACSTTPQSALMTHRYASDKGRWLHPSRVGAKVSMAPDLTCRIRWTTLTKRTDLLRQIADAADTAGVACVLMRHGSRHTYGASGKRSSRCPASRARRATRSGDPAVVGR